jgi:hypothetical protein
VIVDQSIHRESRASWWSEGVAPDVTYLLVSRPDLPDRPRDA